MTPTTLFTIVENLYFFVIGGVIAYGSIKLYDWFKNHVTIGRCDNCKEKEDGGD